MSEPSVVELFLKIERLEKELEAARTLEIQLHNSQILLVKKDKELNAIRKNLDKQLANNQTYQKLVEDLKTSIAKQDAILHNFESQVKNLERDKLSLQESLKIACNKIEALKQQVNSYKDTPEIITKLQNKLKKQQNFLKGLIQPLSSYAEFNSEVLEVIQDLLK